MNKVKNSIIKLGFTALIFSGIVKNSEAQVTVGGSNTGLDGRQNTITTAVPFLMITPDSRAGGMGDLGAATPNDPNALHWNMAKFPFNERNGAVALSYTPWLKQLVPDINLGYLSIYGKINEKSAVAGSLRYFSLGQINFTDQFGNSTGNYTPNELALDLGYASKLSDHFSLGIAFRYIRSDLAGGFNQSQTPVGAGNSFAGDITAYYTNKTRIKLEGKNYKVNYGFGGAITNIGSKISYTSQQYENFIPVNLRLGTYGQVEIDQYNTIALAVDFTKLLVPTNPIYKTDSSGRVVIENGNTVILEGMDPDVPLIQGMTQSFYDAPGGFKEELREINYSAGLEYWYDKQFALRAGYFHESPTKGNRKYLTFGTGFKFSVFGLDLSYLVAIGQNHPLNNTLRFSFLFDFDAFASQTKDEKKKNDDEIAE
ncbi:MAG: type IX secretion system outer membrane channel protein PorV [Bacteroidia bacterium]